MRVLLASVLKALCGLVFVISAEGFLSQRIGTVTHRTRLDHPFRNHPYSNSSLNLGAKNKKSCAVLVDAESTPYQSLNFVLDWLNDMGYDPEMRNAYGDLKEPNSKPFKNIQKKLSFTNIDSLSSESSKCTSDAAMIVGAMDVLHQHPEIECFALVTSDSDLTPLVARLNQAGKMTVGFGKQQTPNSLSNEYKEFVFLDQEKSQKEAPPQKELTEFLSKMILQKSDASGWAPLAALGKDFDCSQYGYKTMSKYFDANTDCFQLNSSRDFVRIQLPKERLNHIGNLIVSCHDEDNWAAVKDLEEKFDARLYGYDGMKDLLDDFPELFIQATDISDVTFVRNKIPKKYIQEMKKVIESKRCFHGWSWCRDIEPHFKKVDWRRFGYETLGDLLQHQSKHFLVDGSYVGSMKCMIRP